MDSRIDERDTHRTLIVRGESLTKGFEGPFEGVITFEKRSDGIYYEARLEQPSSGHLATRGMLISTRRIPADRDAFQYAADHALEGLRRARINRKPAYRVSAWSWKSGAGAA